MNPLLRHDQLAVRALTMPVGEVQWRKAPFPATRGTRIVDVFAGFYDTVLLTGQLCPAAFT